jgi:bifunctional non-homologous end joining protein LigD
VKGGVQWTVRTARDHLSFQRSDGWADYWKTKQSITFGMKILGFKA